MTSVDARSNGTQSINTEFDEELHPIAETRAHWSLFLPSLIVALVYGFAWVLLAVSGQGDGALAKIMFLVLMIAPPVLLAHAFLRFKSIGLALTKRHVLVAKGWPRMEGQQFPVEDLTKIGFRCSSIGRWLGVGKVIMHFNDGRVISVSDISDPRMICDAIQAHITSLNS